MVWTATLAVATAAAVLAVLIGLAIRSEMVSNADEVGEARAEQVADLASRGILPRQIDRADDLEAAVQVVHDGEVVSSTRTRSTPDSSRYRARDPASTRCSAAPTCPSTTTGRSA